jgi:heme/copper-type cytochrome/quinol oxidase subunit 1
VSTTSLTYEERQQLSEVVVREPLDHKASWIRRARSADHKVIGTTLIGFSLIALALAGITELLVWAQLAAPDNTFLTPERFYRLHTLSDTSYLYFFALPLLAGLATYVMPLQIGARSSAFPRLSALGSWMIVFGGVMLFASVFFNTWEAGINISAPMTSLFYSPGAGADFWLVSTLMVAGGLTFIAVDLAVTFKVMRADGMTLDRVPAFAYATAVFAYGILVTAPVLAAACILMLIERQWELFGIFSTANGGNALLWKTLFQWWAHSAPYLVTVLAAGIVSEILPVAARTRLANPLAVKKSIKLLAVIGILSFGVTFFSSPVALAWQAIFMVIGLAILVPSAVLIVSWIQTLRNGSFTASAPSVLAAAFILAFTFNTVASAALAVPTLGQWLSGSEFGYAVWVSLVFGGGGIAGIAGLLYWFPKITGRNYPLGPAKAGIGLLLAGSAISLLSLASLGIDGFPREISRYPSGEFQIRNIEAGIGTLLAAIGMTILIANLISSVRKGSAAGNDPWHAGTLEWFVPSPPPANNFDAVPTVMSDAPLHDLRARIAAGTGELAGSVAQSPTSGRPSLRESK